MPETTIEQSIRVHHGSGDKYRILVSITPSLALVEMVSGRSKGMLAYIAGDILHLQREQNQPRLKQVVELLADKLLPFDDYYQLLLDQYHPIAPS